MTITLHLGDCLEYMRGMADGSVDMVITDPPYPELKGGIELPAFGGVAKSINKTVTVGDIWNANLEWMDDAWRVARLGMIVFCTHHSVDTVKNKFRSNAIALATWYKRNTAPWLAGGCHNLGHSPSRTSPSGSEGYCAFHLAFFRRAKISGFL